MKTEFIYAIVDVSRLSTIENINEDTLRYNNDKSKCIIKSYKEFMNLKGVHIYSKAQILLKLQEKEWR